MMTLDEAKRKTPWLRDSYFSKLVGIARGVEARPLALAGVIYHESGHHGSAWNRSSDASGLMQWMPQFAPHGIAPAALRATDEERQLDWVRDWFSDWHRKIGNKPFDPDGLVYMTVFAPGRLSPSADDSTVAFVKGSREYAANVGLDFDKDGKITAGDLTHLLEQERFSAGFEPFAVRVADAGGDDPDPFSPPGGSGIGRALGIGVGCAALAFTAWRFWRA